MTVYRAGTGQGGGGPHSHLTVLDLSRVLAGPWCTQLLADLGATVIKIERPGAGDDTRAWGPPYLKDAAGHDTSEAAYYLSCNRGKLSVAVDFTTPEGRQIVQDLARQAAVLVENYKVGGLAKYGLDYATIAALNHALSRMPSTSTTSNRWWTSSCPPASTSSSPMREPRRRPPRPITSTQTSKP